MSLIAEGVACRGVYDHKYAELHSDRIAGATTAKKLWQGGEKCDCCNTYTQWKQQHPKAAKALQVSADKAMYEVFPNEEIVLDFGDQLESYVGTI